MADSDVMARLALFSAIVLLGPVTVCAAQGVEVSVSGLAMVSFQPIDDSYVGGPYLSPDGIGGLGPGIGLGVNAVTSHGVVVAAEFTTAMFELEQAGRLVPGGCFCPPNEQSYVGGSGTTRLHDRLLSGLVGYAKGDGGTRAHFLIGAAIRIDSPTVDTRSGEHVVIDGGDEGQRFALTGGFDIVRAMSSRISLVFGARYAWLSRVESQRYLGIGSHVLRGGGGLRVRLD